MTTKNKIIIVSDIHIGINATTNWYQQPVHEPFFNAALEYAICNSDTVQELIILGDLLDFWTYLPTVTPPVFFDPNNTSNSILSQNPNIFGDPVNKIAGQLGKAIDALGGNVSFVPGNHDMTVTQADLDYIYTTSGNTIKFQPDFYFPPGINNADIVCAHGHLFSMLCCPDTETANRIQPLPLGYYVTRTGAFLAAQGLTPQAPNVAYLPNTGEPVGLDITDGDYLQILGDLFRYSLGGAITALVQDETGYGWTDPITMPDGSTVTLDDAFSDFSELLDTWESKTGLDGNQLGYIGAVEALKEPDVDNDLSSYATAMADKWNSKIVVMGHTHIPVDQMGEQESEQERLERIALARLKITKTDDGVPFVYANSGFNCPSIPDMSSASKAPTFVEIEIGDASYTVNINQVSFVNNEYVVQTVQSQAINAG
jgi:UDP-2,3-diacylglucosamine pyrophosphatase LpxH